MYLGTIYIFNEFRPDRTSNMKYMYKYAHVHMSHFITARELKRSELLALAFAFFL
jgi:hypothetical protein